VVDVTGQPAEDFETIARRYAALPHNRRIPGLDVYPDGRALRLGPRDVGIIRARYRNSLQHPELLTPGKTEHFRIELYDIAHAFLPGHRIRIEISSSYAPVFNPNSNTGNPVATDTQSRPAEQTIFHDGSTGSYVDLPVMPNQ
jgi:putative CocE/NonD family hydrolase